MPVLNYPKVGSRWKHNNGNEYTVILIANPFPNEDYPPTVVYVGGSGIYYAKTVQNFLSRMSVIDVPRRETKST